MELAEHRLEILELELHASNRFDFHLDQTPLALVETSGM
jgi:hypothetical protein